jgi:hypothetical protein
MFDKKGNIGIALVVVVALFIIIAQVVDLASRECSLDNDCDSESYCGSDFQCHKYPSIEKINYVPAALVLGFCIIAAAFILRSKKSE